MALVFTESFDGVTDVAHLADKWGVAPSGGPTLVAARNGNGLSHDGTYPWSYIDLPAADQHATVIVGFALNLSLLSTDATFHEFLAFGNSTSRKDDNAADVSIGIGSTGDVTVYTKDAGSQTVLGTAADVFKTGWQYIEIKLFIHDTTGTVEIKADQVTKLSLTGKDTKPGAGTTGVWFGLRGTNSGATTFDDIYVATGAGTRNNDFFGDCKVECLRPNANGAASQLLGSDSDRIDNYLLVDEQAVNDADYVGSAVDGEQDTYAFGDLASTTGRVAGVQIVARALKMDAGAKSLALLSRVGTTETAGADNALTTAHKQYSRMTETDPAAANWTIANVNAAEFGVRVRP